MNGQLFRFSCCSPACIMLAALLSQGCSRSQDKAAPAPVMANCPDAGAGSGGSGTGNGLPAATDRSPVDGTVLLAFNEAADIARVMPSAAGQAGNLNAQLTLGWDGEQGDPDNGSLRLEAPFNAYNQQIDIQFPLAVPADLTGKVVYLRVKLDEGFSQDPSAPGGMIVYAQTGDDFAWGQAEWTNVEVSSRGKWREYSFEMAFPWREVTAAGVAGSALGFNPARVRHFGLILHTGGGGSSTVLPTPAVFHIDSIGYWGPEDLQLD